MWVSPTGCVLLVPFFGAARYILLETTELLKGAIVQTVQQRGLLASSDSNYHACSTTPGMSQIERETMKSRAHVSYC